MKKWKTCQWGFMLLLQLLAVCSSAAARAYKAPVPTRDSSDKITFILGYQLLYSTHSTLFRGISVEAVYSASGRLHLGLGAGFAETGSHPDNGWNLVHLRYLPVYMDNTFRFGRQLRKTGAYCHASQGYSFCRYKKQDPNRGPAFFKVKESGFYFCVAPGISYRINAHSTAFLELGYKGFKHSFNNMDVNPHGTNLKIALAI